MARSTSRPLSPHLTIWKWGPHMLISILHRVTGDGMAIVGALGLVWWLMAAATGPAAYAYFMSWATCWVGYVVMIGLTWAFFEHLLSGLRHFVLDIGAGYELKVNRSWSILLPIVALFITGAIWACIFARGM
ncbi:succinate dehydrogenase, cytochrome b556 subunit [Sphingobium aquiterrae]|uniref:succinate dehydrogenase, cytochrome b556 subunit n=1 Tax=Sphingobium aquiterrae TaxID=2038656 RepID=UPI003016A21D